MFSQFQAFLAIPRGGTADEAVFFKIPLKKSKSNVYKKGNRVLPGEHIETYNFSEKKILTHMCKIRLKNSL
jgi:hypothetical protein